MSKAALLIMAAGLGSRFKGGIKQMSTIDESGHIILDYAIYDAISAGFDKVVIVLRKDIVDDFEQNIGKRLRESFSEKAEIITSVQDITDIPKQFTVSPNRVKPWGTGHAILSAKGYINEPFVVIGADDYFGKQAFANAYKFLTEACNEKEQFMSGYILKNTLSENGTVARAVCDISEESLLLSVTEAYDLISIGGDMVKGTINGEEAIVKGDAIISMNMWGFHHTVLDKMEKMFTHFLAKKGNDITAEFLLPEIVDRLISRGLITVKMVKTTDKWFGVTYMEDSVICQAAFKQMIEDGLYPKKW